MYCRRWFGCLCLVLLAGCSREPAASPARIAVLRFENLTPDGSLDWMGRAASEIIEQELAGGKLTVISSTALHASPLAEFRTISAPGVSSEMMAAVSEGATRVITGSISRVGNRLMIDVIQRDPVSGRTVDNFSLSTPDANGLYVLADGAARRISPQVKPFDSKNNGAIADWARALEERDFNQATGDYSRAVTADPRFATAWLGWIAVTAGHGDRAQAEEIAERAAQHAVEFNPSNRARLKLASAGILGDRPAALAAMQELVQLNPNDPITVRNFAQQSYAARQYQASVSAYRILTQLVPDNPAIWNEYGYAAMGAGDYQGAMSALQMYQRLRPQDANPFDSQGDVAFGFGKFDEAEKLYDQATAKNPAFQNSGPLYKSAASVLMRGDVAAADKKFQSYLAARKAANDPLAGYRAAQWLFWSGRRDEGYRMLSGLGNEPRLKPIVLTQLAIWDLQMGRRDRSLKESQDALQAGGGAATTVLVRFASEEARTAEEWSAKADKTFANPQLAPVKELALGYALFLAHDWEAAAPIWKELVDRSSGDDYVTPLIYAQILTELKRGKEAAPWVRLYPVFNPNSTQESLSMVVPQVFATKAEVDGGDAVSLRKVFAALGGK